MSKYEEAEREYQRALEIDGGFWQAFWGLSELHAELADRTREKDIYQDALTEINSAIHIAVRNSNTVDNEHFLDMYLLRGHINTALGNHIDSRGDYLECKKYDENNLKVHRNLRRINKILGEKASLRWMRIPLLSISGAGLLATCLAYFWLGRFDNIQFYAFASTTFTFIILGILLPIIRRVKIGKVEMEFETTKEAIATPTTTGTMER